MPEVTPPVQPLAEASVISPTRKWGTLVVLSLALAIIIIDTTILNVSLSTIIREFNTTIQSIQWVITAYSLTLAALTITGGRLGDFFGRKRMFVVGAVIFAIGSAITSFSHNVPTMIWGEAIIEGIGAALMMPATAALLVTTFKGRERAIAFGVWGGIAAASSAIGPILGGYLTTYYSWRWAFRINIFVALLLVIGSIIIREVRDNEEKPTLDYLGVLLSAAGLLSLVFGFIEASRYGWWRSKEVFTAFGHVLKFGDISIVPVAILAGVVILTVFVIYQNWLVKGGRTPLVSPKLFANRQFTGAILTTTVLSLSMAGLIFSIPIFLQSVHHLDALHTGLAFLPMSLTLLVVAPLSGFLSHKVTPRLLVQLGMIFDGAAFLTLRYLISPTATAATLAPGLILFGIGMGLVMAQVNNIALSAVSPQESGEAAGVNNTMRQIGQTLGSAILGSVLLTALSASLISGVAKSRVITPALKPALTEAVTAQASAVEFGGGIKVGERLPSSVKGEIATISQQATVDADRRSFEYSAVFVLLGLVFSFLIPNTKNVEREESVAAGH